MACVGVCAALTKPSWQHLRFGPNSCISKSNPSELHLPTQLQFRPLQWPSNRFCPSYFLTQRKKILLPSMATTKGSVGSVEYVVESETRVEFEKDLIVPGCPSSMVLLGTGYREKVFAIIGVKVYAAGFYVNLSVKEGLSSWKGKSSAEILEDSSLFNSIFNDPAEKSLKISLVRDVDGDMFWNALKDVISPRIKEPTATDNSALSTFRNAFQGRPLKKGTVIILTWVEPSKMLVSISIEGPPSNVDAVIESGEVTTSLFDGFFGESPVSPILKASVANGVEKLLANP